MKKLLSLLIIMNVFFFSPSAFSDGSQRPVPPNGGGSPFSRPNTVNTNGTVISTPATINGTDKSQETGVMTSPGNSTKPPTVSTPES